MKLSDFVAQFLAAQGVDHVFGVTGGAVVHLFDSVVRRRDIKVVFTHHEQAAAFAASAFAKAREGLGVAIVTTGPGGTNAITGLAAAWLDSVPCLFISGQTRRTHTTEGLPIRQLGTQQLDIVSLVRPLTKSAVMLDKPSSIKFELEKAVHLARSERPGPVWLDIPLDFQWTEVNPDRLRSYRHPAPRKASVSAVGRAVQEVAKALRGSKRPLVLAGGGIRSAGAVQVFNRLVKRSGVPFLTTWNATDYVPSSYPGCMGRPGIFGQRGANMVPSACDLLVSIGTHIPIPVSGTRADVFAPQARRLVVDIDPDELDHLYVPHHGKFCCDAGKFLRDLEHKLAKANWKAPAQWRKHCLEFKTLNSPESKSPNPHQFVDPYRLVTEICRVLRSGDSVVVDGGGTINQIAFQSILCGLNQRIVISGALCSMGSGLPESIGVSSARPRGNTIMLCGDGSFQFNIQELQTIIHHKLPIKVFIINNDGYLSIRQTQKSFLKSRYFGSNSFGGLSLPNTKRIADCYSIPFWRLKNEKLLRYVVKKLMKSKGPSICEVCVSPSMEIIPRQGFKKLSNGTFQTCSLDNMFPFLQQETKKTLRIP